MFCYLAKISKKQDVLEKLDSMVESLITKVILLNRSVSSPEDLL